MIGTPPAFEGKAILRGAMLYFVPGEIQRKADTIWHRMAEAVMPGEAKAWTGAPANYTIHFYHTDHLGSTRIITDAAGAIYEATNYLPFGEIATDNSAGEPDRFKFTGQMWDPTTNLYYYGARYYDPEIGRFTQADTIVPRPLDGQTFNRYTYCANNPYKFADPTGHFFMEGLSRTLGALGLVAGAIIGGLAGMQLGLLGMVGGAMLGAGLGYGKGYNWGAQLGYNMDVAGAYVAGVALQTAIIMNQLYYLSFAGGAPYAKNSIGI